MRDRIPPKLAALVERIGQREGAVPPTQEGIERAAQWLAAKHTERPLSVRCGAAEVHYVEDGRRIMVAVYAHNGTITDAECSCGSREVCAHLLAVLASPGERRHLGA